MTPSNFILSRIIATAVANAELHAMRILGCSEFDAYTSALRVLEETMAIAEGETPDMVETRFRALKSALGEE